MIDLNPNHLETVKGILAEYAPHCEACAFGSRATWTARDYSDLDLAVVGEGPLDLGSLERLKEAFEESDLPIRVDVLDWHGISESFQKVISREYVIIRHGNGTGTMGASGEWRKAQRNLDMASEWRKVNLGDCVVINDSTYSPKESWPFINYLDTGSITGNHISEIQTLVPGEDKIPSRARRKVRQGDIVYSTVRPNQRHFGLIKNVPDNFLVSTGFAVIRGKEDVAHTDFIYWYLAQEHIVEYLHTIAEDSTSAYPSIRPNDLEQLELDLPPLPEQRRIAHILGALDDKIELNRRMNATLEQMARALFKSWFIDFDPVRAKMSGRWRRGKSLPGLPAHLYDVFPSRLVPSELGEAPEGWEVKALGDCFNLTMGQSPPGSTYNDDGEGLPFFQGRADFGFRYPENRRFCTAPTRIAQPDDTLVSVRAPVGSLNMAWERCCIGRGLAALRHKSNSTSFTYYSIWAIQRELQEYEHTGTVFGAINKGQFEDLKVVEPDARTLDLFGSIALGWDKRIRQNVAGSRALAEMRDTMLPKLVSGEIYLE